MEKIRTKLIYLFYGTFMFLAHTATVLAADPDKTEQNKTIFDRLLPRPGEVPSGTPTNPELGAIGDLPEIVPEAAFTSIIKTILGASMILTIIAIGVVAFYYVTGQGEEEDMNKAKSIILYLVVGMADSASRLLDVVGTGDITECRQSRPDLQQRYHLTVFRTVEPDACRLTRLQRPYLNFVACTGIYARSEIGETNNLYPGLRP